MKDRLVFILCLSVCAGLLLSAGLKLWDLPAFYDALSEWTLLPAPLVPVVTIAAPVAEVAAVTLWLTAPSPAARRWVIPGLLAVFTLALVVEDAVSPAPVPCGCLGKMIDLRPMPAWRHAAVNLAMCVPFVLQPRRTP